MKSTKREDTPKKTDKAGAELGQSVNVRFPVAPWSPVASLSKPSPSNNRRPTAVAGGSLVKQQLMVVPPFAEVAVVVQLRLASRRASYAAQLLLVLAVGLAQCLFTTWTTLLVGSVPD